MKYLHKYQFTLNFKIKFFPYFDKSLLYNIIVIKRYFLFCFTIFRIQKSDKIIVQYGSFERGVCIIRVFFLFLMIEQSMMFAIRFNL